VCRGAGVDRQGGWGDGARLGGKSMCRATGVDALGRSECGAGLAQLQGKRCAGVYVLFGKVPE